MVSKPPASVPVLANPSGPHIRFTKLPGGDARVGAHRFENFRFDVAHLACCAQIRDGCSHAWRLTAPAYVAKVSETGFHETSLGSILSGFGASYLPKVPNASDITRDPYFTDLSEVVGLELLKETEPSLVIPVVRAYHRESVGRQHVGIDLLGYSQQSGDYDLFIIEVMASDEDRHPPGTVGVHRKQLLDETLNEASLERLRKELSYVHAEAEDKHKPVLNGFIVALIRDRKALAGGVIATPVLVRPQGLLDNRDWKPFQDSLSDFVSAVVPSSVLFKGVDCGLDFVELFTRVLRLLRNGGANPPGGRNATSS